LVFHLFKQLHGFSLEISKFNFRKGVGLVIDLSRKKCVPCEGGVKPIKGEDLEPFISQISNRWKVIDGHHIQAIYLFQDFIQALDFTNEVGKLAEEEGHHPDIHLSWGRVEVLIWTHAIDGLSENDFILAAKIDKLI
jgi:4a-hydroxytetrahydrobiopterin dehydratase